MKRLFSGSIAVFLLMAHGVPVLAAGLPTGRQESGRVSRADFLQRAVDALYGDFEEKYSAPFVGIPLHAQSAVGLARSLNALRGWTGDWDAPVTRGEALQTLFSLGKVQPQSFGANRFRDVLGQSAVSAMQQAFAWNLLQPLTPNIFGWSRALKPSELDAMIAGIGGKLELPLAAPPKGRQGMREPPQPCGGANEQCTAQPRSRRGVGQRIVEPPKRRDREQRGKRTITIEAPQLDTGSRRSGAFNRLELPRSDLLETLWGLVGSRFLYEDRINADELPYALAEAMLKLLDDPYTTFLRPQETQSFQQQIQGELSGIGAQVQLHPLGGVEVVTPLTGSPALRAGVRPGDRITHVDGESIIDFTLTDAVQKIRGPVGSTVTLTVEREGGNLTLTVVRDRINMPEITVTEQDGVLVAKIVQFGEKTRTELKDMLRDAVSKNPRGIVLDLRNNPGGLLDAAVDVASHFLPEGSVVAVIRSKDGEREEFVHGGGHVVPAHLPTVVIVNAGSASASEIVAGALQDYGRATILGEKKTFGKGTVQEVVQFKTGESAKMTIAEWLTPKGRSIEKTGITPDIVMEEGAVGSRDEMLLRALQIIKAKGRG